MLKLPFLFLTSLVLCFGFVEAKLKYQKTYYLEALFIGHQKNTLAQDKAFVSFDTKKRTAKMYSSCNWINTAYQQKRTHFLFTRITPDKLPCPDYLDGLEADLLENLPKVNRLVIKNKKLFFFQGQDTLLIFHE